MMPPLRLALRALLPALLVGSLASAQTPDTPTPGSWAAQLDELTRWTAAHRAPAPCEAHCFALARLHLTGSVAAGLRFELEGAVLAAGPVAVPLFGAPSAVRLSDVTLDGAPAVVGFDESSYFVQTAARRFVLRGSLAFVDGRALAVPGPVNALDVDVSDAVVAEGAHLAGVADRTLHFAAPEDPAARAVEPTVSQRSHALRVGREITFVDRVFVSAGRGANVVRLPLLRGAHLLSVAGASDWHAEGGAAVVSVPDGGAVTLTGTLERLGDFEPDPASDYEPWLLESDPEHRLTVTGDARQRDLGESPIGVTQPNARLYLVERGHHLSVTAQTLEGADALAAVVHAHRSVGVLTRRGDLVSDDAITYENNGVDYLALDPAGRPIFLASDGAAERILRDPRRVLVPLRNGRHELRLQTLRHAGLGPLGGALEVATPTYALTASRVTADLGLPAFVTPLAVLGGDAPWFALNPADLGAVLFALALGWSLELDARRRALLGAALAGAWFVSGALYAAAVTGALLWVVRAFVFARGRSPARVAGFAAVAVVTVLSVATMVTTSRGNRAPASVALAPIAPAPARLAVMTPETCNNLDDDCDGTITETISVMLPGLRSVALTLPSYDRVVSASRELVTPERPFRVRVYYATTTSLGLLALAWLSCVALYARFHREALARWARALRGDAV